MFMYFYIIMFSMIFFYNIVLIIYHHVTYYIGDNKDNNYIPSRKKIKYSLNKIFK